VNRDGIGAPERIAFAGDWHANTAWARSAIRYAADAGADVIVQLGDFGYDYPASFVQGVDTALREVGLELWFVDGNHEAFPTLLRYPVLEHGRRRLTDRVWHLPRGYRWSWAGVSFLALGGAHSVDRPWREPGTSWWSQETLTDAELAAAAAGGPVDVLVSHDCPSGVDLPGLAETAHFWPPTALGAAAAHRARIRTVVDAVRPGQIWQGHYHRRYDVGADLGYGPVHVHGLHCDGGSLADNVVLVRPEQLHRGGSDGAWADR
jgi:hypothetical protein